MGFEDEVLAAAGRHEEARNLYGKTLGDDDDDEDASSSVIVVDPDAPPTLMTLRVACRRDLWRVLYKSPDACIRFPALEFEIGADSKRRIDSVYNHITSAVWNLSSHLRGSANAGGEAASGADAITDLCEKLNEMLDVEEPFEIVVDDPIGASIFKPDDGIDVVTL